MSLVHLSFLSIYDYEFTLPLYDKTGKIRSYSYYEKELVFCFFAREEDLVNTRTVRSKSLTPIGKLRSERLLRNSLKVCFAGHSLIMIVKYSALITARRTG